MRVYECGFINIHAWHTVSILKPRRFFRSRFFLFHCFFSGIFVHLAKHIKVHWNTYPMHNVIVSSEPLRLQQLRSMFNVNRFTHTHLKVIRSTITGAAMNVAINSQTEAYGHIFFSVCFIIIFYWLKIPFE